MAHGPFEIYQIRCFVAVASELNFRRAAERLNMTQPPLSRQIKLLEHGLGVTLLDRDQSGVRLTPAGESFLNSSSELLQKAEAAVLAARQAERGELGSIALGFVPSAGLLFVPRLILAVRQAMPGVAFTTKEQMGYEIEEGLLSGALDMGINRSNNGRAGIESIRVVSEPFVLAAPRAHPLASKEDLALRDLDDVAFINFSAERGGIVARAHAAAFASAGISPRIVWETSHTHAVLALVNSGLGVALVPRSAQTMCMEQIVFREIDLPDGCVSTLYLNISPHRRERLHHRVREVLEETFATCMS